MSVSDKTFVIEKEPDHDVPEQYLRSVISAANSCGGYAIQVPNEKGAPSLVSDRSDVHLNMDGVKELLERAKKHRVLLTFSKLGKVEEKFLQPYDFTTPGDVAPLMSFAIDGEFPTFGEAIITEAYGLASRLIMPNFPKFLKLSEGDLKKFIAEINDPTFVDALMARIGDRGIVCFLPPTGPGIWLGKNKLGSQFPWGKVSNTLGYKEEAPTKPAGEEPAKEGWWKMDFGKKLPVAEDVQPKAPTETPVPGPLNLPTGTPDTRIDAPPADPNVKPAADPNAPPPAGHWETMPPGMNQKDQKKFVRRVTNCGSELPEGWDKPGWRYWVAEYPKAAIPKDADTLMAASMRQAQQNKDMRDPNGPRPVPGSGHESEAAEVSALVLTKEEASAAETTIIKIMDRQGKEIPSPLEIQKAVSKYPAFSKKFGVDHDRMLSWLPKDIEEFAKTNPKAFFHWHLEASINWQLVRQELAELKAKDKAVVTPTDVHVLAKEELKPEEKKTGTNGWATW